MRCNRGRSECGESDGGAAPARNGGEGAGALHRFANKAKIVGGAVFERHQHRARGTGRFCRCHAVEDTRGREVVKFFALQSEAPAIKSPLGFQPYWPMRGTKRQ